MKKLVENTKSLLSLFLLIKKVLKSEKLKSPETQISLLFVGLIILVGILKFIVGGQ